MKQADLFSSVLDAYAEASGPVSNQALYSTVARHQGLPDDFWHRTVPVGASGEFHSLERRKVRWYQQTLKRLGLIERLQDARGQWQPTQKLKREGKKPDLTFAPSRMVMLGFSTRLGLSLWANAEDVFSNLGEPIHLCFSSLPYPLATPRAYGNPTQSEYVDWACRLLEPIIKHLAPGGSLAINLSNDIFLPGMPARSLYREELLLALCKRFSLYKMDEFVWSDPTKAPGPVAWASKKRYQLNVGWEPVYWLTNDPLKVFADNRRVLRPHTEEQLKLIAKGGVTKRSSFGDGSQRKRPGAFGNPTAGAIPRNLISVPHRCPSQVELRKKLAAKGLPIHGATFPLELANFFVKYLTEPGQLVVEPCAGWGSSNLAAENNGRRWVATERVREYVLGSQLRFTEAEGFESFMEV